MKIIQNGTYNLKNKRLLLVLLVLLFSGIQCGLMARPFHKNDWSATSSLLDSLKTEELPDSSKWVLLDIVGVKSKKQPSGSKTFLVMKKGAEKISGYTSCNTFKGKLAVKDSSISITELTIGNRLCDETTNEEEKIFIETLQKCTSWKSTSTKLYLYQGQTLLLEFKSALENTKK